MSSPNALDRLKNAPPLRPEATLPEAEAHAGTQIQLSGPLIMARHRVAVGCRYSDLSDSIRSTDDARRAGM